MELLAVYPERETRNMGHFGTFARTLSILPKASEIVMLI
jgi:hypothetical protein